MRLSQSQADLLGTFIGLCVIAAILIWSCGCSVPRQPAGYVPDDVRHAVTVWPSEMIRMINVDDAVVDEPIEIELSIYDPHEGYLISDENGSLTINVSCGHMCTHLCYPPHSNPPGSTCCMCFQKIPLPPPCDHFYVKQAIPIDSPLAGFDLDWMPCKCINCNDLTICK